MPSGLLPGTSGHILCDSIHLRYLERTNSHTESRTVFTAGWAEGGWGVGAQRRSPFGVTEGFPEVDGGDGGDGVSVLCATDCPAENGHAAHTPLGPFTARAHAEELVFSPA